MIVETLKGIRGDEQLYLFQTTETSKAGAIAVGEPALPRRRRAPVYGVPFSHVFTALEISPIELEISPIELEISTIDLQISTIHLEISPNRLNCRYLQLNWRYLQFNWRYLQIGPIWRYLQFNCRYLQFDRTE